MAMFILSGVTKAPEMGRAASGPGRRPWPRPSTSDTHSKTGGSGAIGSATERAVLEQAIDRDAARIQASDVFSYAMAIGDPVDQSRRDSESWAKPESKGRPSLVSLRIPPTECHAGGE